MSSKFGKQLQISIFGQSHGAAIGVVMDGLPAGEAIDSDRLAQFMNRRRPGQNDLSTPRKEADAVEILSGVVDGFTCGAPLCAVIHNTDQRSRDYSQLRDKPRPGHADFVALQKYSEHVDLRGGGHFSGRLTAPLCIAGGIAKQVLARRGIFVGAHLARVSGIADDLFPLHPTKEQLNSIAEKGFPVCNDEQGAFMQEAIRQAAAEGDSVGGVIECAAIGVPAGIGNPMFDGVENRLAAALFGIPAVKGIEFGAGFAAAERRGSENNDAFAIKNDVITTTTNHAGGILGGITDGMPVTLRVAIKPTPSIAKPQQTVNLSQSQNTELTVTGRHDPCIAHRAVPVVEAVTATVLLDLLLEENGYGTH